MAVEIVDAGDQGVHVLGRGHTQLVQGLGHAFFKNVFQLVPLAHGLGGDAVGHVAHAAGGFVDAFFCHRLGLALDAQAFFHQGVEHLAAFFLGLGERAQASQPDLLGRILDGAGQGATRGVGGALLLGTDFLKLLDHAVFSCGGKWLHCTKPRSHCVGKGN